MTQQTELGWETAYQTLLAEILFRGVESTDRTGVGTLRLFGRSLRVDLSAEFPALTLRRIPLRSVFGELAWFLRGQTNNNALKAMGVSIWDEWAGPNGDLGPIYGAQWRGTDDTVHGVDQLAQALWLLRSAPDSRRIIVNSWQVGDLGDMRLPPCHLMYQIVVIGGRLNIEVTQRSADMYLGVPFNVLSYATLALLLCEITGFKAGELRINFGDAHIYLNHREQVVELLRRIPYTGDEAPLFGFDREPGIEAIRCAFLEMSNVNEAEGLLDRLVTEKIRDKPLEEWLHDGVVRYHAHARLNAPVAV